MASTNLCTRDNVKSYLGLSGTAYDAVIDLLIPAASEAIEKFCGRRFGQASYTEYRDGEAADRVVLRERPVTLVTAVWDDPDRDFDDDSRLDADEYVLEPESGIVRLRYGSFADGVRNVKVQYTAGYSAIPQDLAQACLMLVAAWFHRGREAADGLDLRRAAETTQQYLSEPMPAAVAGILATHREHTV
jgi:uncharacterized phiE125 gp8 family phage protein